MMPIIRNQPSRSEAPSCGWHAIAAEAPAQKGLSSPSEKAMKSARYTEAHSRRPKSGGSPAAVSVSLKYLSDWTRRGARVHSIALQHHAAYEAAQCCICKFMSSGPGIMLAFRFVMIQSDPPITRITMSIPKANASTLLVLSGPVVMCRKKTR